MKAPPSPPRSRRLLDIAIERFADGGEDPLRIRRVMANAIVSAPRSHRAHDLIDLQLIMSRHDPDWAELRGVCRRLFAYRKQQAWPPAVESGPDWDTLYAERVGSLPVLPTAVEAVAWVNALIARIDAAR